ncbi:unnamed protein product, partial [Closterium sp. NIES-53]
DSPTRQSTGLEKSPRETSAEKRKRPAKNHAEGTHTGVDVLLGEGRTVARPSQPRACHTQARGPAGGNNDGDFVATPAAAAADPSGSRAPPKRRAIDSAASDGAVANLLPSQLAALLALLQKQVAAPAVMTPAATIEADISASAKTANVRNNISTSARVAAPTHASKRKAPAVEEEPATPVDIDSDSDSDEGEEPNNPSLHLSNDLLPPLPSPHPSTAASAFNHKGVRDQAEVFEALHTYLAHVEHKIHGGDATGALKTVAQAQDLIKRRFDVLVVADHAGFDVAERYQLLKTTAVLTLRSFKMAVADMAALKRMKTGFPSALHCPSCFARFSVFPQLLVFRYSLAHRCLLLLRRRVPCQSQPAVSGPPLVVRRPSSPSPRVPLPPPPVSSLPVVADPASDRFRAEHSTVTRLLATVITDPSFESAAASALVTELIAFAAHCRLDYAASLVAESASVSPPSVGGECALGTDVLEDRQEDLECLAAAAPHLVSMLLAPEGDPVAPDIPTPRSYAEAIAGPYSSQWKTAMDAEMASWKSTSTYVDEVPHPGANIVSGMWIFRVKRPPSSPPVFKARYVARGFSQREGVEFFQTFSPTPKMTTLRVLLHVAAQRDYELHSLDFSTAFLQGSLHEEIWPRRPPGFTGSFPPGTQWSLRRPVYGLRQAPREWHDTLRTTLAALGFAPSTADPSLFLRTDTSLPPFYILVYVDDLVFATADTEALALVKSELQKRHTCTDLGELRSYLGLQITRDRARRTITLTQSHMVEQVLQRFGFTWSSAQATPLATGHSLSAPPSVESVEPSGPYPELVGCLITLGMGLVLGGRGDVVLTGHSDASWVDDQATHRSSLGYTFSLGSGSVSWRSTHSSSVLGSSCEAEIYATAMAAQELR